MSNSEDSPPPLPSSPPPGPPSLMENPGREDRKKVRSSSEHFKSLQAMLSNAKGMYASPQNSSPAPPPNKRLSLDTEIDNDDFPKLSHANKSRPKRKVRPPTRASLGEEVNKRENIQTSPITSLKPTAETSEINQDTPVPLPPLPMSAPPEAPPETSLAGSLAPDLEVTPHQDSSGVVTTPKVDHHDPSEQSRLKKSSNVTESMQAGFETISKTTSPSIKPNTVISSFSERRKKLQEKRASQAIVNSQAINTKEPTERFSDIPKQALQSSHYDKFEQLKTNTSTSSGLDGLKSEGNQNSTQSRKRTTIEDNAQLDASSYSKMDITSNSNSLPKKGSMTTSEIESKQLSPLDNGLSSQYFMNISTDKRFGDSHNDESGSDTDDELPPTPPPPIPDFPPSDESEPELNQEELNQEEIGSDMQRPAIVTLKVSFRTRQRKDEWKRRSEQLQLNSSRFDSLPLLGASRKVSLHQTPMSMAYSENAGSSLYPDTQLLYGDSITEHRQTIPIATESTALNDSSTDSLPSLPDTLPPTLPDGLPPALPEDPPPTAPETPPPDIFEAHPSSRPETPSIFRPEVPSLDALEVNSLEDSTSTSNHLTRYYPFSNVTSPEEPITLTPGQISQDDFFANAPSKIVSQLGSEYTTDLESKHDSHVVNSSFNHSSDVNFVDSSAQHFQLSPVENSQDKLSENVDQLRERKYHESSNLYNSSLERSVFDALVAVEPTAEETEKQNISLKERRQLALMAPRGPDADFQKVLNRWKKRAPHSKVEDEVSISATSTISLSADELTGKEDGDGITSRMSITDLEHSSSHDAAFQKQLETNSTQNNQQSLHSLTSSYLASGDWEKTQYPSDTNNLGDLAKNNSPLEQVDATITGSKPVKQIRVISEGTPPSSPNVSFTRIQKESWKLVKPHSKNSLEDDLSSSASTGDILVNSTSKLKQTLSLQKTSSLHSLNSRTKSPKSGLVLPWSKSKKNFSKKPPPISPLAAVTVTTQRVNTIPHSPTNISLDSDDDSIQVTSLNQLSNSQITSPLSSNTKQPTNKGTGLFEAVFSSSPKPNLKGSHQDTPSQENLAFSVPVWDQKHEDVIEQQLAKVKEQRKMTHELLRKDPLALIKSLTPRGSPRNSRPSSFILGTDIYKLDPAQWSTEQVCKWLDRGGLGTFKEVFKEKGVTGKSLLQMDVQFFDELGIDSPEIREIFLAKIYELSNPSSSLGEMEDDFLLSVDTYNSDDWKKLQAAVDALKSPVLDDTIELEPSAIGQFIRSDFIRVRSHSTPNIADLDVNEAFLSGVDDATFDQQNSKLRPSKTIHSFRYYEDSNHQRTYTQQDSDESIVSQQPSSSIDNPLRFSPISELVKIDITSYDAKDNQLTSEWVAGLPREGLSSRKRALTEPSLPLNLISLQPRKVTANSKAKTLPRQSQVSQHRATSTEPESKRNLFKQISSSSKDFSLQEDTSLLQTYSDRQSVSSGDRQRQNKQSELSQSLSAAGKGLLKLYMNSVQNGVLYKSFLIAPSTTTEHVIAMALDKANLTVEYDPHCYNIWNRDIDQTSRSSTNRLLLPSDCPLVVQTQWPQPTSRYFELRIKEGIQHPPRSSQSKRQSTVPDTTALEKQLKSLLEEKNNLLVQLDEFYVELQNKEKLKENILSLTEERNLMKEDLKKQQDTHTSVITKMKEDMDELMLSSSKLEDQLAVLNTASTDSVAENLREVVSDIQTKYSEELASLKKDLKEKNHSIEELRIKLTTMEETESELGKVLESLKEHKQQVSSLVQELARKEETIHKLGLQLDQTEASVDHALALQSASKNQQELFNRTVQELKEQVSRLTAEVGRKEQLVLSLVKERDRLVREHQTKDNLRTSLEADLASYKALQTDQMDETERIRTLQRSLSVHEVALASVQSEYEKQREELGSAEGEIFRLKNDLAKKEDQLSLLSSSEKHHSRFSLYGLLDKKPPHKLIRVLVDSHVVSTKDEKDPDSLKPAGVEMTPSQSTEFGIKVSGLLGECVVAEVSEDVSAAGVQIGDQLLEINDTSVMGNSQREVNTMLRKQYQSQKGSIKLVIARPLISGHMEDPDDSSQLVSKDGVLFERYKKLNTSLKRQVDSQSKEVDSWRNECERLKAELIKNSTSQMDKKRELSSLQPKLQELKSQLEDSENARLQLRGTLDELSSQLSAILKERNLSQLQAAVDSRQSQDDQLMRLQRENELAMNALRTHLVSNEDLPVTNRGLSEKELAVVPREELVSRHKQLDDEFSRNKSYLEQLLTIIIDQQPDLLYKIGETQKMKDQVDGDSWC